MLPTMAANTSKAKGAITIYLAPELEDQLRVRAAQERRSLSNLVTLLIDQGLNPASEGKTE